MKLQTTALIVLLSAVGSVHTVEAQVSDLPSRPYRGLFGGGRAPDPNRLGHQVSVTTNLLGGYDDITSVAGSVVPDAPVQPRFTGSIGFVDSTLRYRVARQDRSLELSGHGYLTSFTSARPSFGGDLYVQAATPLGRRTNVTFAEAVRNDPLISLGEFGQIEGAVGPGVLPDSDPTLGLAELRSWSFDTSASLSRDWTARQSTSFSYSQGRIDYSDSELGYDSRSRSANVDYTWRYSRVAGMHMGYGGSWISFPDRDFSDTTTHSIDAGLDYNRRLSPTRQLALSGDVGAVYLRGISLTTGSLRGHWAPAARASARVDIGRSWALNGDYGRTVSVLDRISVQRFASDAFSVRAGGLIGQRFDTSVSGGLSRGRTPAAESRDGQYRSYTATAQVRWAVAQCCATAVSYSYYDYTLQNVVVLQGLPSHSQSNIFRVGVSVWLPLYGPATDAPGTVTR